MLWEEEMNKLRWKTHQILSPCLFLCVFPLSSVRHLAFLTSLWESDVKWFTNMKYFLLGKFMVPWGGFWMWLFPSSWCQALSSLFWLGQRNDPSASSATNANGFCSVTCIFQIKNKPDKFISAACKRQSKSVWTHKNQNFQNISVSCKRGGPHILNGNHLGQFGLTGNPHLHSRMERMERLSLLSKSWLAQGPSRQDLWLGQQQHMTYEQPLGLGGLFRWCLRWSQGHAPSRPPCSAKIFFCSLGS